jgi:hypothetical protein
MMSIRPEKVRRCLCARKMWHSADNAGALANLRSLDGVVIRFASIASVNLGVKR